MIKLIIATLENSIIGLINYYLKMDYFHWVKEAKLLIAKTMQCFINQQLVWQVLRAEQE